MAAYNNSEDKKTDDVIEKTPYSDGAGAVSLSCNYKISDIHFSPSYLKKNPTELFIPINISMYVQTFKRVFSLT